MASGSFDNLPANVTSKFEPYCNGCEARLLEVASSTETDEDGYQVDMATIKCKWRSQCRYLFRQLEKRNE